jgi:hypothetical protein
MFKHIVLAAGALLVAQSVIAGPQCHAPQAKWQDPVKFQAQLKSAGYDIKTFKVSKGQCYEIYGFDKSGERVEIYFDPETGKPVQTK